MASNQQCLETPLNIPIAHQHQYTIISHDVVQYGSVLVHFCSIQFRVRAKCTSTRFRC